MKNYTTPDVSEHHDEPEVQPVMFRKLERAMGLHYGIWEPTTPNIEAALQNVDMALLELGNIQPGHHVLDAGCGIGGSSIYLAEKRGCKVTGMSHSQRQVDTASSTAKEHKVDHLCHFLRRDYTQTGFETDTFDVVWAIESFGSAQERWRFFHEMRRILKPGGKIVMADTFKSTTSNAVKSHAMQTMLKGWGISDILSVNETKGLAEAHGFKNLVVTDVSKKIKKSVHRLYWASKASMIGLKLYNLFYNATPFSKIHCKTGLAQKKAFENGEWGYYLMAFEKLP